MFGELRDGLLVRVPLNFARRLLEPGDVLLNALSKYGIAHCFDERNVTRADHCIGCRHFCFEVAIGMNGAVWLRSGSNSAVEAVVIRNALLSAVSLDDAQTLALVEELVKLSKTVARPQ
jgi:exosome complex RNA-binding protein Rrp4